MQNSGFVVKVVQSKTELAEPLNNERLWNGLFRVELGHVGMQITSIVVEITFGSVLKDYKRLMLIFLNVDRFDDVGMREIGE